MSSLFHLSLNVSFKFQLPSGLNWLFLFVSVFQWCCFDTSGIFRKNRNTLLLSSSPLINLHVVLICDYFFSWCFIAPEQCCCFDTLGSSRCHSALSPPLFALIKNKEKEKRAPFAIIFELVWIFPLKIMIIGTSQVIIETVLKLNSTGSTMRWCGMQVEKQTADGFWSSLVWVCSVWSHLSAPIMRNFTVQMQLTFCLLVAQCDKVSRQ